MNVQVVINPTTIRSRLRRSQSDYQNTRLHAYHCFIMSNLNVLYYMQEQQQSIHLTKMMDTPCQHEIQEQQETD